MKVLEQKNTIISDFENKYSHLKSELERAFNYAVADFILYTYPSKNNRPNIESLELDFISEQWIRERIEDIISRAGGISVQAYSENGMNWEYASSHIDPALISKITPMAAVPR